MRFFLPLMCTLVCLLTKLSPALASVLISPMSLDIDTQIMSTAQVRAHSQSDDTQYFRLIVKKVLHPATDQEREVIVSAADPAGLIVSPQKFALSAGGSRLVRIVPLQSPLHETVYRVYFEPATLPKEVENEVSDTVKATVSIQLVYGVLVRVLPENPQPPTLVVDHDRLHNQGNVRVAIKAIDYCANPGSLAQDCVVQTVDKNLYPGQSLPLTASEKKRGLSLLKVRYQPVNAAEVTQNFTYAKE